MMYCDDMRLLQCFVDNRMQKFCIMLPFERFKKGTFSDLYIYATFFFSMLQIPKQTMLSKLKFSLHYISLNK